MKLVLDSLESDFEGKSYYRWTSTLSQSEMAVFNKEFEVLQRHLDNDKYHLARKKALSLIQKYQFNALKVYPELARLTIYKEQCELYSELYQHLKKELENVTFSSKDRINYYDNVNRSFFYALYNYVLALYKSNKPNTKLIIEIQTMCIKAHPSDNCGFRYSLVYELIKAKKYKSALFWAKKYIKPSIEDKKFLYAVGLIALKQKDHEQARIYLKKAKKRWPLFANLLIEEPESLSKYVETYNAREIEYINSGSLDEAIDLYSTSYQYWQEHFEFTRDNSTDRNFLLSVLG